MSAYRDSDGEKVKVRRSVDLFEAIVVAIGIAICVGSIGFFTGSCSGFDDAKVEFLKNSATPKEKEKPQDKVMCFDQILTEAHNYEVKCTFWDQSMELITFQGKGAVLCRCPGSKSKAQ